MRTWKTWDATSVAWGIFGAVQAALVLALLGRHIQHSRTDGFGDSTLLDADLP